MRCRYKGALYGDRTFKDVLTSNPFLPVARTMMIADHWHVCWLVQMRRADDQPFRTICRVIVQPRPECSPAKPQEYVTASRLTCGTFHHYQSIALKAELVVDSVSTQGRDSFRMWVVGATRQTSAWGRWSSDGVAMEFP